MLLVHSRLLALHSVFPLFIEEEAPSTEQSNCFFIRCELLPDYSSFGKHSRSPPSLISSAVPSRLVKDGDILYSLRLVHLHLWQLVTRLLGT